VSIGGNMQPMDKSDGADIAGFLAFWARAAFKRHTLFFSQALEAVALNFLEVCEQVSTAAIGRDEAKAFCIVKPFYGTGLRSHVISLR
jgi:hypothetical protein